MFAQIIPLHSSFIGVDALTYEIPEDLDAQIGDVVEVPLKKEFAYGLIHSINSSSDLDKEKIKSATRMVARGALYPYQISVIESLAHKYVLPISEVAELFMPRSLLERAEKAKIPSKSSLISVLGKPNSPVEVQSVASPEVLTSILATLMLNQSKMVVIFPTLFLAKDFLQKNALEGEECVLYSNTLTPKKRSDAIEILKSGKKKYFL